MSSVLSKISDLLTSDPIFLLALFAIFFFYAMYFGRGKIVSIIISFYPAMILYRAFPFFDKLASFSSKAGETGLVLEKLGIFLVFLVIINTILGRYVFSESIHTGAPHLLRTAGFSVALVLLVILFSYNTANFDILHNFSPSIDAIFARSGIEFWWNLAPLIILAFL